MNDRYERGIDARRAVLGEEAFDRNPPRQDDFSGPFSDLLVEHCWGTLWANDEDLSRRTRSLITIGILASAGRLPQLRTHLQGAVNNGCTLTEIREALLHVAVYAGVPAAAEAFRQAREVLAEALAEQDAAATESS